MVSGECGVIVRGFVSNPAAASHQKALLGLVEHILHLAENGAALWLVLNLSNPLQFLQQFALPLAQLARRLDSDFNKQVSLAVAIEHRNALAPNLEHSPGLRAFRNLQRMLRLQRRDLNFSSQS